MRKLYSAFIISLIFLSLSGMLEAEEIVFNSRTDYIDKDNSDLIIVKAKTNLPDNTRLYVILRYGRQIISSSAVEIKEGGFIKQWNFSPKLFPGYYELAIILDADRQRAAIKDNLEQQFAYQGERVFNERVQIGTDEEIRKALQDVNERVSATYDSLRGNYDDLVAKYANYKSRLSGEDTELKAEWVEYSRDWLKDTRDLSREIAGYFDNRWYTYETILAELLALSRELQALNCVYSQRLGAEVLLRVDEIGSCFLLKEGEIDIPLEREIIENKFDQVDDMLKLKRSAG